MQLLATSAQESGDERLSEGESGSVPSGAARVRVLLAAAFGPLVTGYAAVASLLALIALTAEKAQFSAIGALSAAGPGWLGAHQVPIEITGHPLGMLPLLPTIGVGLLIARTAGVTAQRLGCHEPRQAIAVVGVLAGAHATFGLIIAVVSSGSPLGVGPLAAFFVPGFFAALTATAGLAKHCGLLRATSAYLDPLARHGLRAGVLGMAGLLACGALVCTLSLALSTPTVYDLFEPSFGSSFGLFLLSVGYLPNAIVAGLSFASGPGFSIGSVSVNTVGLSGGPVPGLPLLAGIPDHHAGWWPLLMLLPAGVGVLVGWSVRKIDKDPIARLRTVGVAGALVGFGCVVLGTLAGGRLGNGPFDPVSVPVGLASVVAFCWIVIPGCFVAFFLGPHEPAVLPGGDETETEVDAEVDSEGSQDLDGTDSGETGTDEDTAADETEPEIADTAEPERDDEEVDAAEPVDGSGELEQVPELEADGGEAVADEGEELIEPASGSDPEADADGPESAVASGEDGEQDGDR